MPPDDLQLEKFALLLDVDGTLLDIAPTPLEVVVPDGLRATLIGVSERSGGALALVSGRPINELDTIFAPLRLPAVGGHGAEIRLTAQGDVTANSTASLDPDLKQRLLDLARRHPAAVSEDKGYSVALHYRRLLERGLEIVDDVYRICRDFSPESYELLAGKAVIEIKAAGFDKGMGVRELMKHEPFHGRIPIFIGDDITDEAAFAVMPEFKGLAYSVGREAAGVEGSFIAPDDVRSWLTHIATQPMAMPPVVKLP